MSGVTTRMTRPEAIEIAKRFVALIEPYTDQLIVAGSLRRKLAMIGDVEIVAVPKTEIERTETVGLFDSEFTTHEVDQLDRFITQLVGHNLAQKRLDINGSPRFGPTLKYLTFEGARVDLFTPCAERFGLILAIRTGPWQLSRWLVTQKSKRGGLPDHLVVRDGWVHYRTSGQRIPTPDEESFFSLLDLPWIPPQDRDVFAQKMLRGRHG